MKSWSRTNNIICNILGGRSSVVSDNQSPGIRLAKPRLKQGCQHTCCVICQPNGIMIGCNMLVENFSFVGYWCLPYSIPLEETRILMRRNNVRSRHSFCSFLVGHHTCYLLPRSILGFSTETTTTSWISSP